MALFSRRSTPTSRSRQITLWVVGALLFLQLLAVLSTWHCPGPTHRANQRKSPFSALLLQLSGHGMCEGEPESSSFPFEGVLRRSHTVRRQRPYAYAFCLTSVHHLCTALVNVVRLRKLHSFQASCLPSLSPVTFSTILAFTLKDHLCVNARQVVEDKQCNTIYCVTLYCFEVYCVTVYFIMSPQSSPATCCYACLLKFYMLKTCMLTSISKCNTSQG